MDGAPGPSGLVEERADRCWNHGCRIGGAAWFSAARLGFAISITGKRTGWLSPYHPTHRKMRDGWGTRAFRASGGERTNAGTMGAGIGGAVGKLLGLVFRSLVWIRH
jgi:hypothetical protein